MQMLHDSSFAYTVRIPREGRSLLSERRHHELRGRGQRHTDSRGRLLRAFGTPRQEDAGNDDPVTAECQLRHFRQQFSPVLAGRRREQQQLFFNAGSHV